MNRTPPEAGPPGDGLPSKLREEQSAWTEAGLLRTLELPAGRDFCSNDYLGLSRDPRVLAAARSALDRWGAGSRAARLLRGHLPPHSQAERAAAEWLGCEAALLFPSGWQANLATLGVAAGRGDVILSDRLNHASLIDGARLSGARIAVFAHNDPEDLELRLRRARSARRRLIVVESVYSVEGDLAPLQEYASLARAHDAWLIVDEAHATGLYGETGAGRCQATGGAGERLLARTITGGKALGVCGAFVAGSRTFVETLVNRGRAFVFTTAPAPAVPAALTRAIGICREETDRRQRPHQAAQRLREALRAEGVVCGGEGAIVPVVVGDPGESMRVAARVKAAGFDVRAVRPPTVPPDTSRLRLVCHADHDDPEIDAVARAVAEAVRLENPTRKRPSVNARRATPLVICGTDTGVGKTVVAALLVRAAVRRGRDTRYLKPVQTGDDSDTAVVRELTGLEPERSPAPPVSLPLPASVDQAARAADVEVGVRDLLEPCLDHLGRTPDACWLFECAGGLMVPLNDREDQADFLVRLGAPMVLVARSGLGTLNHTRLTLEAASRRGLALRALFLVGEPHPPNVATLRRWIPDLPVFEIPWMSPLERDALDRWLDCSQLEGVLP